MTFDAEAIFEAEPLRRGVAFAKGADHVYQVQIGTWNVSASLENVRRDAERAQDPGIITRFVDHVLGVVPSDLPWSEASALLFWAADSGYPITTEVLRISDDGIEAIGRFPT